MTMLELQPPREKRAFDPRVFRANADGTPFFNRHGYFMPRGGRKPRVPLLTYTPDPQPEPQPTQHAMSDPILLPPPADENRNGAFGVPSEATSSTSALPQNPFADIDAAANSAPPADPGAPPPEPPPNIAAETCIGIIQTAFCMIGDEEGLLTETEKEVLRRPLQRVLDKYNLGEKVLPAEIDLAVAVATLFITRIKKPKTATWWVRVKAWFASKFFAAKGRALAGKVRRETADMPEPAPAKPPAPAAAPKSQGHGFGANPFATGNNEGRGQ